MMVNRPRSRTATAVVLVVGSFLNVYSVKGADRDRVVELDIVASTSVDVSPVFEKACEMEIAGQVRNTLSSLSPVDASRGDAVDGAARYRLLINHKGTLSVGKSLTVTHEFPRTKEETVNKGNADIVRRVPDKSYYVSTWYLPARQKATLSFKLLKWEQGAYQHVDNWTLPVTNREAIQGGIAPVARLEQDDMQGKIRLNPPCPITLDEAIDEAYCQCEPGPFESAFVTRWVKGRFSKLTPKDGEVEYEISVENKSPWMLSQVYVESPANDQEIVGYVEFAPGIAPGKSGKGKGSCFISEPLAKKVPRLRLTEARFEPVPVD